MRTEYQTKVLKRSRSPDRDLPHRHCSDGSRGTQQQMVASSSGLLVLGFPDTILSRRTKQLLPPIAGRSAPTTSRIALKSGPEMDTARPLARLDSSEAGA